MRFSAVSVKIPDLKAEQAKDCASFSIKKMYLELLVASWNSLGVIALG